MLLKLKIFKLSLGLDLTFVLFGVDFLAVGSLASGLRSSGYFQQTYSKRRFKTSLSRWPNNPQNERWTIFFKEQRSKQKKILIKKKLFSSFRQFCGLYPAPITHKNLSTLSTCDYTIIINVNVVINAHSILRTSLSVPVNVDHL